MEKIKMLSVLTLLFVLFSALEISQDRLENRNAFLLASVVEEGAPESSTAESEAPVEKVPEAVPETPEIIESVEEKTETISGDVTGEENTSGETQGKEESVIEIPEAEASKEKETKSETKTETKEEIEEDEKVEVPAATEVKPAPETTKVEVIPEPEKETKSTEEIAKKIEADNLNRDLICSDLEGRKEVMILGKRIEDAVQVTFRVLSTSQCPNLCKEEQFFDLDPEKTDKGKCKKISKGCYDGGSDGMKFTALESCEKFYESQAFQGDFQSRKEEVDLKQEKKKMKEKYQSLKNTCVVEGAVNCDRQKEKQLFQCLKEYILPCFEWDPFLYGIEELKSFEALSELGNKILEWRNQTGK